MTSKGHFGLSFRTRVPWLFIFSYIQFALRKAGDYNGQITFQNVKQITIKESLGTGINTLFPCDSMALGFMQFA